MRSASASLAVLGSLLLTLAGCADQPPASARSKGALSAGVRSEAARETTPTLASTDLDPGVSSEDAHRHQMQSIHHQGHSEHEFRAIHNMDEMHRMGGVPAMPPLDELESKRPGKMGPQ